ncbi:hypothetical protein ACXVWQ_10805, partial [Haemophilus sp. SZY H57]
MSNIDHRLICMSLLWWGVGTKNLSVLGIWGLCCGSCWCCCLLCCMMELVDGLVELLDVDLLCV